MLIHIGFHIFPLIKNVEWARTDSIIKYESVMKMLLFCLYIEDMKDIAGLAV